jgi:ATP-dependent DNA helicase RecG
MKRFKSGEIKCIISTTVIEVGVDVPEATIMVIENAERFGLAQLHQLRGRVGRGNLESWCFLVTYSEQKPSNKRLEVLTKTNDGFKVAEEDLKMRGPGQFIGFKQSGMMDPRVLNLMGDIKLLAKVKEVIDDINNNTNLDENIYLKSLAKKRYYSKLQQIILN